MSEFDDIVGTDAHFDPVNLMNYAMERVPRYMMNPVRLAELINEYRTGFPDVQIKAVIDHVTHEVVHNGLR